MCSVYYVRDKATARITVLIFIRICNVNFSLYPLKYLEKKKIKREKLQVKIVFQWSLKSDSILLANIWSNIKQTACYKRNHTSSYYPLSTPCCNDTEVVAQLSINVWSQYSGINGFKLKPCNLLEECWQTSMTKAACPPRFYHLLPLQWVQQQEFLSVPLLQVSPSRSQCSHLDFWSKWSLWKVKITAMS